VRSGSRRVGVAAARAFIPKPAAFGAAAKAQSKAQSNQDEANGCGELH